jgi:FkbM family methyltransferase
MSAKFSQTVKYAISRYVFRKQYLIAKENRFGSRFKFKVEDVIGRHIYKRGEYEDDLSNYLSNSISFNDDDIALDIGANIGWYSILLNKLMPATSSIYAFEPDPLNYRLLTENINLNNANNIVSVNKALSNQQEIKKLYRYSNKNLGRHSLLDINKGEYVEVEALVLDKYLESKNIDISKVKFAKIDIEGYEYFALSGATKVLQYIQCLISEFVPSHMKKGGVDPVSLINLLEEKGFTPNVIKSGAVCSISEEELLNIEACDIIWLKN